MSDDGEHPDNVLFTWYERYIGEPEAETDVYLGFALFFIGIAFAAIGLVLFLLAGAIFGLRTADYATIAQPGYLLAMLSVPAAMLGIVILLPTQRRVVWGALAGAAIALIAAAGFLVYYPAEWFEYGPQQTMIVVGTYAVGVAISTAATGAALVGHHLERQRAPRPSEIEPVADDPEETVTDEQVRADIEAAMDGVELTWGGVTKTDHRRLELATDYVDEAREDLDIQAERVVSDQSVEDQVAGLRQLKGGTKTTATSKSTVDNQTAALRKLKEQKRRDEVPSDAPVRDRGVLARLLARVGLR